MTCGRYDVCDDSMNTLHALQPLSRCSVQRRSRGGLFWMSRRESRRGIGRGMLCLAADNAMGVCVGVHVYRRARLRNARMPACGAPLSPCAAPGRPRVERAVPGTQRTHPANRRCTRSASEGATISSRHLWEVAAGAVVCGHGCARRSDATVTCAGICDQAPRSRPLSKRACAE